MENSIGGIVFWGSTGSWHQQVIFATRTAQWLP